MTRKAPLATNRVAQSVLAASCGGVPPPAPTPGGTPGELAGEDACATFLADRFGGKARTWVGRILIPAFSPDAREGAALAAEGGAEHRTGKSGEPTGWKACPTSLCGVVLALLLLPPEPWERRHPAGGRCFPRPRGKARTHQNNPSVRGSFTRKRLAARRGQQRPGRACSPSSPSSPTSEFGLNPAPQCRKHA
jgi:hypothetical protein